MARRRFSRGRGRRRGGLLVKEQSIQRGIAVSGMGSFAVHLPDVNPNAAISFGKLTANGSYAPFKSLAGHYVLVYTGANGQAAVDLGTKPIVRFTSADLASESPFYAGIKAQFGALKYQCGGEKPSKIRFSRENSDAGQLWYKGGPNYTPHTYSITSSGTSNQDKSVDLTGALTLINFTGATDSVDATIHYTVDSAADPLLS